MNEQNKGILRARCLSSRSELNPQHQEAYSASILAILHQHLSQTYTQPVHLLCYRSTSNEVDTSGIFQQSSLYKNYAPVTHHTGEMHWLSVDKNTIWQKGNFGIMEPMQGKQWQPSDTPTILLCPVVGFDRQGNRIGMGKGCFDRWLEKYQHHIEKTIGLAFSCQECDTIAHEPHDIALHAIITEKGWITCPSI
jgi:5-formyltetrahydrofolate cyclo-ligase